MNGVVEFFTDLFKFLEDPFWALITGIISSTIVYLIVTFIPIRETARYKATFYRRKLSKILKDPPIQTKYVVKSNNLEEKCFVRDDLVTDMKEKLCENGFTFEGQRGSTITFKYISGTSVMDISLSLSYQPDEDDELIVDYVECCFKPINIRYKNFDRFFVDILQAYIKLERSLRSFVDDWRGESLTCEIKRLYEFVGVLKDLNMSSLQGKIGGEYEIEIFENHLVVYGKIETKMGEMIKDIITFYY